MRYALFFFFNDTATTEIYTYLHTLSLHDALPILSTPFGDTKILSSATPRASRSCFKPPQMTATASAARTARSEEHTSELQSLMRISYAVFCLKKQHNTHQPIYITPSFTITPSPP